MYNVIELAHTVIKKYYRKTNQYPTSYILQKLIYYCQIFYMRRHDGKLMFKNDILCSAGGPCIREISDLFSTFGSREIVLPNDILDSIGVNQFLEDEVNEIIEEVFSYLNGVYTDYALLSDRIKSNENCAWYLQKQKDSNMIKQQKIEYEFLKREADSI